MKTIHPLILLFISAAASRAGDTPPQPNPSPVPDNPPYAVVARDASSRVWEKTVFEVGPTGQRFPVTHRFTELGTGIHYRDQNGQWAETLEAFSPVPGGAAARPGRSG